MGPIFALIFVLTAAAASFLPLPQKTFFDDFRTAPTDLGFGTDKFFQNYWGNPAIGLNHRYWDGPVPFSYEYRTQNYIGNRQMSFQELFERPIMMVTPSATVPNTFTVFYLHNGLRSLYRFKSFSWLQQYVRTPGMKGLVFFPKYLYNVRFFETPISSVVIQDDCRLSDFSMIYGSSNNLPYLFVAPESVFDLMHFENIAKVSEFKVYNDIIEILSPFSWLQNMFDYIGGFSGSNAHSSSLSAGNSIAQSGSVAGAQGSGLAGAHAGSVAGSVPGAESSSVSAEQAGSFPGADRQNYGRSYSGAQPSSSAHSQAGSIVGSEEGKVARSQSSSNAEANAGSMTAASPVTNAAESQSVASAESITGSSSGSLSRSESLSHVGSQPESAVDGSVTSAHATSASVAGA